MDSRDLDLIEALEKQSRPMPERREHTRHLPIEVRCLRGARRKYGALLHVEDLSTTGMRFRSETELAVDSTIVVELVGAAGTLVVPARVLRADRLTSGAFSWFEIGCQFKQVVDLAALAG